MCFQYSYFIWRSDISVHKLFSLLQLLEDSYEIHKEQRPLIVGPEGRKVSLIMEDFFRSIDQIGNVTIERKK